MDNKSFKNLFRHYYIHINQEKLDENQLFYNIKTLNDIIDIKLFNIIAIIKTVQK